MSDEVGELIEALRFDKKTFSADGRRQAVDKLLRALQDAEAAPTLLEDDSAVAEILGKSARGDVRDFAQAMRLLCMVYLWKGGDSDEIESGWRKKLEVVIKKGDVQKRAPAVEAFGLGLFVSGDSADSVEAIEFLASQILFEPTLPHVLLIATLRVVALLSTSLDGNTVADVIAPTVMDAMPALLQHDKYEVQLAVLQLVATFASSIRRAGSDRFGNSEFDLYQLYGYSEIKDDIEGLRGMQNKEIKLKIGRGASVFSTKRVVAAYIDALEGDESGCSKEFGIAKQQVRVVGVSQMVQLDFFTAILKEGLLSHARSNPFIHEVFGWEVVDDATYNRAQSSTSVKREKQYANTSSFKARSKDRRRGQRKAADYQQ